MNNKKDINEGGVALPQLCSPAISELVADMEAEALKQESYWGPNWERPCYGSGHAEGYAQATRHWMKIIQQNARCAATAPHAGPSTVAEEDRGS